MVRGSLVARRRPRPGLISLSPLAIVAVLIVAVATLAAIAAPLLAPADPLAIDLAARFDPPVFLPGGDWSHPLGTDQLGRDLAARILFGLRVSLLVGVIAATLSAAVGIVLGLLSGFFGGILDIVAMRLADIQLAFPLLVLAIAIIGIVGSDITAIVLVLGLWGWASFGRVVRAEVLVQRELEYVEAARVAGSGRWKIILRHILPNTLSSATVLWTFAVAQMIIIEGALSFLGLGVKPPNPSLGGIMSDGRQVISTAWWVITLPGLVIVALVLGFNTLGDALRDYLDPRTRRGR